MADETLLTLASDIVSAHVSNNNVTPDELPVLIKSVYASLASLGNTPEPAEAAREPAVSVRASVKPDLLICLECGAKMKMLKRHLSTDHGLTPAEYRTRWNLNANYPMVAPDYAAKRKELAVKIGLGRKPKTAQPMAAQAASKKSAQLKAADASGEGQPSEPKERRKAVKASAAKTASLSE
jgi:predicted transcriptional regulator